MTENLIRILLEVLKDRTPVSIRDELGEEFLQAYISLVRSELDPSFLVTVATARENCAVSTAKLQSLLNSLPIVLKYEV